MKKAGFRETFRYRFDSFMAKGGISIFVSLVLVFVVVFIVLTAIRGLLFWMYPTGIMQSQHQGFWRNAYITFLELTDPGNMCQDITASPWFKIIAVVAGLAGVIMLSALIAFITTALDQKLNELKRGRSRVLEEDHTVILGWNEQRVVEVLRELVIANESEPDACVAILANHEKVAMDDILRLRLPDTKTSRLVTRSGDVSAIANLEIVSVDTCKSVIILAECEDSEPEERKAASDAAVIQTILAVSSIRKGRGDLSIVAEIFDPTYRDIVQKTFSENVVTIDTIDILSKIMVQTSRSVGLSVVYNEILSFDGCEMYFHHADWGDISFGELPYRFPDGVPMGLRHTDGSLLMNPPPDTKLAQHDDILILADDDSTIEYRNAPVATPRDLPLAGGRVQHGIEKQLILGWTHKSPIILKEYADYVKPGSKVDIVLQEPADSVKAEIAELDAALPQVSIQLLEKNRLSTQDVLALQPFTYDNIVILAEEKPGTDVRQVDAKNIVTLLLLRDIFHEHRKDSSHTKLITEVLDSQNYSLVSQAGVKDVIISNRLVSMILAQISEDADIKRVYDDIFQEDGSEIYLKPASLYFSKFPTEATFADMIGIAQKRREVCLGVKIKALERNARRNYGVTLIPKKTQRYTLVAEDSLVVLAEDDT